MLNWSIKLSGTLMNIHIVFCYVQLLHVLRWIDIHILFVTWPSTESGSRSGAVKCPYFSINTAGAMFKVNLPCFLLIWQFQSKYFSFNFIKFTLHVMLFYFTCLIWTLRQMAYGHEHVVSMDTDSELNPLFLLFSYIYLKFISECF